jgi:hypothetical protein
VEIPKKAPLTRYAELWTRSPFTTPPPPAENAPEVNPFEDLALRGIAPLSSGRYLITLVNKKNPTETTTIDTERSDEYEVVKIERDSEKALGTVVHLKKGSISGTVAYDEKLSTLKPPAPPKQGQPGHPPAANQPPTPPGTPPGTQPAATPPGVPQPRARVLPPTTPGATPGAAPTTNRFQPGSSSNRFQPGSSSSNRFQSGGDRRDPRTDRGDRPSRR